jgi:hypothetical protein
MACMCKNMSCTDHNNPPLKLLAVPCLHIMIAMSTYVWQNLLLDIHVYIRT